MACTPKPIRRNRARTRKIIRRLHPEWSGKSPEPPRPVDLGLPLRTIDEVLEDIRAGRPVDLGFISQE